MNTSSSNVFFILKTSALRKACKLKKYLVYKDLTYLTYHNLMLNEQSDGG